MLPELGISYSGKLENVSVLLVQVEMELGWKLYGWAGIRAVRGSRNKRGSQAIRDLAKVLADGNDVGVTPDGSRGPVYSYQIWSFGISEKLPRLPFCFSVSLFQDVYD